VIPFRRLLRAVLREEVVVTGVEGVVGWLFYNALIGLYGFSWLHAVLFGLSGYTLQVTFFQPIKSLVNRMGHL